MKQKYLREHIPLFEAEDNEELVEGLIVLGIESFLNSHEGIKRGSGKLLREDVERICLDFEKYKSGENSAYRDINKQIENVSRKLDSSKADLRSETTSLRGVGPDKRTPSGSSFYGKLGHPKSENNKLIDEIGHSKILSPRSQQLYPTPAFKKRDEVTQISAGSNPITYKKPSVNQESPNNIWHQPQYLVDQKQNPTPKITQMNAPPLTARSRALSQDLRKPATRDSSGSISAIEHAGSVPSEIGFGFHSQPHLQPERQQRPNSADPRARYALPGSEYDDIQTGNQQPSRSNQLKNKQLRDSRGSANLPVAPSSEQSQRKKEMAHQVSSAHYSNPANRRVEPTHANTFAVDAQSILMSESQSLHGDCHTPARQARSEVMFIPASSSTGTSSQARVRPPVARAPGQQIISGVNNYTRVGAVRAASSNKAPHTSRNKSANSTAPHSANKGSSRPGSGRTQSRDSHRGKSDAEVSMHLDRQPKAGNGTVRTGATRTAATQREGVGELTHSKSGDKPVNNYKQVQSRIKDLVQKDKEKWSGQDSKHALVVGVQYAKGLDHLEFLTQEDCTFRPDDEMTNKPDMDDDFEGGDRIHKEHRRSDLEKSQDTLNISRDESSLTSTQMLMKQNKQRSVRGSEKKPILGGGTTQTKNSNQPERRQNRRSELDDHSLENTDELQSTGGVLGIASKLLNSDIMKRLESRGESGNTGGHKDSGKLYSTVNPWKRGDRHEPAFRHGREEEHFGYGHEPSFDQAEGSLPKHASRNRPREPFEREGSEFSQEEHYESRGGEMQKKASRMSEKKEDFHEDDYDMNFHETSRASSSQFSAFCPGEDVKSFFKKEFTNDSPGPMPNANSTNKERHMWSKNSGQEGLGDNSYTSSKLTYGANSTILEKKYSQRSNNQDNS